MNTISCLRGFSVLLFVMAIALALSGQHAQAAEPAAKPEAKKTTIWQYGEFSEIEFRGQKEQSASFHGGDVTASDSTLAGLYKKLTGKEPDENAGTIGRILDTIGSMGWELVLIDREDDHALKITTFYFKRPVN